jgi:hypothetical protein
MENFDSKTTFILEIYMTVQGEMLNTSLKSCSKEKSAYLCLCYWSKTNMKYRNFTLFAVLLEHFCYCQKVDIKRQKIKARVTATKSN